MNFVLFPLFDNETVTNLTQMAERSINSTKNGGEYGIPYLCIHEIDLCTNRFVHIVHNKAKRNK